MTEPRPLDTSPEDILTLTSAAQRARAINAANGWGVNFKFDDIPNYIALIHSEVSEAVAEDHDEKAARELGDVIVRCLDLIELVGIRNAKTPSKWLKPGEPVRLFPDERRLIYLDLHSRISEVLESYRKVKDETECRQAVVSGLEVIILDAVNGMDCLSAHSPHTIVASILDANSRRAYRHGGRRT